MLLTIQQVRGFKLGSPTHIVSFPYDFVQRFSLNIKIFFFFSIVLQVFASMGTSVF